MIKDHFGKALLIWLLGGLMAVCLIAGVYGIMTPEYGHEGRNSTYPLLIIGLIALPILFVWNIYDAYNSN